MVTPFRTLKKTTALRAFIHRACSTFHTPCRLIRCSAFWTCEPSGMLGFMSTNNRLPCKAGLCLAVGLLASGVTLHAAEEKPPTQPNRRERTAKKAGDAIERTRKRAVGAVERGAKKTDKALTHAAEKTDNWVKQKTK